MSQTTRILEERLASYFDRFTRRFLREESPEAVDVEILEPDWGDQRSVRGVRLSGVAYDTRTRALEFALESGGHRIYQLQEVWIREEADGFTSAIQVVHGDGTNEVVSVKRVGVRHPH